MDFLGEFDSLRNPPLYDISTERLYELADANLPAAAGVQLTPSGPAWLTVGYLDLPVAPPVPADAAAVLSGPVTPGAPPRLRDEAELLERARTALARQLQQPVEHVTLDAAELERLRAARMSAQARLDGDFTR